MPDLPSRVPTTDDYTSLKAERDRLLANETKYRTALAAIFNLDPESPQGQLAHSTLQEAPK